MSKDRSEASVDSYSGAYQLLGLDV